MSELETWTAPSESVMWTVTVPLFPSGSVNVQVNAEPFLILTSSGQVTDLTAGWMFFRRNFSAFLLSIVSEPPTDTEHAESVIPRSRSETAMPARRTRQILGEAQDGPESVRFVLSVPTGGRPSPGTRALRRAQRLHSRRSPHQRR